jgi:ADP-heptose:LPS heptosyltransferase
VLAIHPGALGDVLLAIPALRALRRRLPRDARLTLAAQPRIAGLLADLGVVDTGIPFDALGLEALFVEGPLPPRTQALRQWEHCVCWFGARDGTFTGRLQTLVADAVVASPTGVCGPVWRHLLATVGATEADRQPLSLPKPAAEAGRRALERAGVDAGSPFLLVHPGAGGGSKCWPPAGFAAVLASVRRRGAATVLHQGPATADAAAVERVRSALRDSVPVLREPSLAELAGVLGCAVGYLGNDSGVSHLACALGRPAVLLFTSTNARWCPWWPGARCVVLDTARVDSRDLDEVVRGVAGLLT